jgi:hypothetical protein
MRGELGFPFVVARQRRHPRRWALVLTIFGYGQRRHAGMYGTTAQIANAARVARSGRLFLDRSRAIGTAGAVRRDGPVRAVNRHLRGVSGVDAARAELRPIKAACYNPGD